MNDDDYCPDVYVGDEPEGSGCLDCDACGGLCRACEDSLAAVADYYDECAREQE